MFIRTVFSVFFTLLVGVNSANAQAKTKLPYYISNPASEGRDLNVLPVWEHIQKNLGERSLPPPTKLVVMDGGVAANDDITCLAAGDSKSFLSGGFMAKDPLYDRIPHGTGLAGIVCAEPGEVSTGLLPKEVVSVLSYKIADGSWIGTTLNSSQGELCELCSAKAIEAFAASLLPDEIGVISASWGTTGKLPEEIHESIKRNADKVVFVFAAGNNGTNMVHEPCSYEEVVCVSALEKFPLTLESGETVEQLTWFANYDSRVDIFAYGGEIPVEYPGNYYTRASGTSQATPMVAAEAAFLIWEGRRQGAKLTTRDIRQALIEGAKTVRVYTNRSGSGNKDPNLPENFSQVPKADWEGARLTLGKIISDLPAAREETTNPATGSTNRGK